MGIHSISGNYSPLNFLSNGIIILEGFLTNLILWPQKLEKTTKSHIGDLVRERVNNIYILFNSDIYIIILYSYIFIYNLYISLVYIR
jgi:hypothetical protein